MEGAAIPITELVSSLHCFCHRVGQCEGALRKSRVTLLNRNLKMAERVDPCSLSNPESFLCKHISWHIDVDFPGKVLRCTAKLKVECVKAGSDTLVMFVLTF